MRRAALLLAGLLVTAVLGAAVLAGAVAGTAIPGGDASAGQATVGRLEQTLPDQLVEVESGEGARDAQRSRRFVPAHFAAPAGDVAIKTPPDRFVQRRDGRDLALELGSMHGTNLPI